MPFRVIVKPNILHVYELNYKQPRDQSKHNQALRQRAGIASSAEKNGPVTLEPCSHRGKVKCNEKRKVAMRDDQRKCKYVQKRSMRMG